jgi:arginine-tRNA-protein transferase
VSDDLHCAAGELVAVAVLDVLPECVSSVYFFWEPSLSFLSLGKVSALREIAFTQAAAMTCPSLHYYYMGYFISRYPSLLTPGRGVL